MTPFVRPERSRSGSDAEFLFIAGCQRSGTTALLHLLNQDERFVIGRERFKHCRREISPEHFREEHFFSPQASETNYRVEKFYEPLRSRWRAGGVRYIGDKVPFYYRELFYLAETFPNCKILFLIRDLERVAASYNARAADPKDKVWKPKRRRGILARFGLGPETETMDYRRAAKDWMESLVRFDEFVSSGHEDRIFPVHYERFFAGEESYLDALYDFLELPVTPKARKAFLKITKDWEARSRRPTLLTPEMAQYLASRRDRALEASCLALCPESRTDAIGSGGLVNVANRGSIPRAPSSASQLTSQIASHWDRATPDQRPARTRWWESRMIHRHVNRLVAGVELDSSSEGIQFLLRKRIGSTTLRRGVSVGAGIGAKEMRLVAAGVVSRFDLFELSQVRIARGREAASRMGLTDRVRFHHADAFSFFEGASVDLVYWDMALHHMLDVDFAVGWSRQVLHAGGYFCMSDFVGPARFQWSDDSLELVARVRSSLPRRYLLDPYRPSGFQPTEIRRHDPQILAREDPSEAADSDRILEVVSRHFPDAQITKVGGVVYHLALRDIIHNFDEGNDDDRALLGALLLVDEMSIQDHRIDNHYAVALGAKE